MSDAASAKASGRPGRKDKAKKANKANKDKKDGKPTPADLGIDVDALAWEQSGHGDGSIEIAFPLSPRWNRGDWVLMRVSGDQAARVLVFDRNEWTCFIDGARKGEFDDAADTGRLMS